MRAAHRQRSVLTTTLVPVLLVAGTAWVALGWGDACGVSLAENTDPTTPGRACGVVDAHLQWALLLVAALPGAAVRRGVAAYGLAAVATGLCLVVFRLVVAPA